MKTKKIIAGLSLAMIASASFAKAPAAEVEKLGKSLTIVGAEKAGNAAGTIPAFTGGLDGVPANVTYTPGDYRPNPFADDKVKFTITAENMAQYADNLSEAQKKMFEKFPETFKMNVYQTRRTGTMPKWVLDNTLKNASQAELAAGGNGVVNVAAGIPFPIPQNGLEAIWNHILRFNGASWKRTSDNLVVQPSGAIAITGTQTHATLPFYVPGVENPDILQLLVDYTKPARRKGELLVVRDPINQVEKQRNAWQYIPGQRRVRRAPTISYDTPAVAGGGQITYDDVYMYNGSPDRYNWELVGKKEMYISYNNYELNQKGKYKDIYTGKHPNPEKVRWELHRTWVVEATLKEGKRHVYAKRRFYIDEDTWNVSIAENYDARDNLWRVAFANLKNDYEVPVVQLVSSIHHDLLNGVYVAMNANNETLPISYPEPKEDKYYSPQTLRKMSRR